MSVRPSATHPSSRHRGLGPFLLVWSAQLVSLVGNSALRFAFVVQAWSTTGRATPVVLLALCTTLPQILLSPTAGALVDRISRRRALQAADLGGLVVIVALTAVHLAGGLQTWFIYPVAILLSACAAFQYPAMSAAVPLLTGPGQLQRANGLLASSRSASEVFGPALGGALVATVGLGPILAADIASFAVAVLAVQVTRFRDDVVGPPRERRHLASESLEGLRVLRTHPGLRDLVAVIFVINLVMVTGFAVMPAMVLARSGGEAGTLAATNTCMGLGAIAGGVLVAVWGGSRHRVRTMQLGVVGMCLAALVAMAVSTTAVGWCVAILVGAALMSVTNSSEQSLFQTAVPNALQGRVFGAVVFVSEISVPLAQITAALLADGLLEPADGRYPWLVDVLAPVVGGGRGSGMATILLLAGCLGIAAAAFGLSRGTIRALDATGPDETVGTAPA